MLRASWTKHIQICIYMYINKIMRAFWTKHIQMFIYNIYKYVTYIYILCIYLYIYDDVAVFIKARPRLAFCTAWFTFYLHGQRTHDISISRRPIELSHFSRWLSSNCEDTVTVCTLHITVIQSLSSHFSRTIGKCRIEIFRVCWPCSRCWSVSSMTKNLKWEFSQTGGSVKKI